MSRKPEANELVSWLSRVESGHETVVISEELK